ncbi:gibberellin-regulated protein 1-like [Salvia divinorum]|uniref:Gibberellin-regulated protein 1-like n=1 Tax=Salvia divinorum TaxID=28513 RepID=A0ABD1H6J3_SALDI
MANRLLLLSALVLLISFVLVSSDIEAVEESSLVAKGGNRRLLDYVDCGGQCKRRCSLHSRPNVCNRACGTCCQRCKCVPPGTHGNREVCGSCYTDMTTHGNKTKCP